MTVRWVLEKTSVLGRGLAGQTRRGGGQVQIPYKRGWIHPVNFLEMKGVWGFCEVLQRGRDWGRDPGPNGLNRALQG